MWSRAVRRITVPAPFHQQLLLRRPGRARFVSTTSESVVRGGLVSHVLAGLLGGSIVIAAGYTYYHFSPLRQFIETSKRAKVIVQDARQSFSRQFPDRAVEYLRKVSKAYVAVIPGAEIFVDTAFDSLQDIVEAHKDEANEISARAFEEVQRVVNSKKESLQAALEIMSILKLRIGELQALGVKKGGDTLTPLLDKIPGARDRLGVVLDELQTLAARSGRDGERAVNDTTKQVTKILSDSKETGREQFGRAYDLIKGKTISLRKKDIANREHDIQDSEDINSRNPEVENAKA